MSLNISNIVVYLYKVEMFLRILSYSYYARQHICYSAYRLSVCPSVCPSVRRVYHRKTVVVLGL